MHTQRTKRLELNDRCADTPAHPTHNLQLTLSPSMAIPQMCCTISEMHIAKQVRGALQPMRYRQQHRYESVHALAGKGNKIARLFLSSFCSCSSVLRLALTFCFLGHGAQAAVWTPWLPTASPLSSIRRNQTCS